MNNETLTVINLERNYTYNKYDKIIDGIVINRNITINGNGYTIDAQGKARVFLVGANNVTIKNLIIKNANYDGDGAAIFLNLYADYGRVSNCIFINNTASQDGGAIEWNSAEGSVSNCIFINNTAGRSGGAIYCWNDGVSVFDCIFINNTAARHGGAIEWDGESGNISYCVFLNNSADNEVDAIYGYYDIVAYYCWFGNNATNYDETLPLANRAYCYTSLFLNATANPDSISVLDTSEVTFKLYLYNNSEVSEFDNTPFKYITLKLTADNGEVVGIAKLNETATYTATSWGTGSVTASIENAKYTIELTNIGFSPDLSVDSQAADYGNSTIIALNYNASATGTVNITLKGKNGNNYTFTDLTLNATVLLPEAINADEYDVNVTYSGDNVFYNATATGTLTINKVNSTLTVNNITFDYGDAGSSEISFTGADSIYANVTGHDEAVIIVAENTLTVSNLDAGNYTLTVTTVPDDNHNPVTKTVNITVNKASSQVTSQDMTTDYQAHESFVVNIKDSQGNPITNTYVNITINGVTYNCWVDENGTAALPIELRPNTYEADVNFENGNYNASNATAKVVVKKTTPKITAKAKTFKKSVKTKKYTATLKDNTGKAIKKAKLTLKVKGKTYKATTNSKGKAVFKIKKLTKKGTFKAVIKFKGNSYYNAVSKKVKIKIK